MKKLFSFFAFVAIILTFAACGGNEPKAKGLLIKVDALSNKAHYVVTASKKDTYFYVSYLTYDEGDENTLREFEETYFENECTFRDLLDDNRLYTGDHEATLQDLDVNTEYILFAFYAEEDEEGKVKIIGDIEYLIFKTLPQYQLNGVFSVSDTKKVRFSSSNLMFRENDVPFCYNNQTIYFGKTSGDIFDLVGWGAAHNFNWNVLTADEWWYLFKERPHADELFAQARINGVKGLIIMPDNWLQRPEKEKIKTSKEMGLTWNESLVWYAKEDQPFDFDGYMENVFYLSEWAEFEFAGAVFLPAAGYDGENVQKCGYYWSLTEVQDTKAYSYYFAGGILSLWMLREPNIAFNKTTACSIRLVWKVE